MYCFWNNNWWINIKIGIKIRVTSHERDSSIRQIWERENLRYMDNWKDLGESEYGKEVVEIIAEEILDIMEDLNIEWII